MPWRDHLARTPFFAGLDGEALDALASVAVERSYERGETICRQDEPKPGLFVLLSGSARAVTISEAGREHVTRLLGPGDSFADVATVGHIACASAVDVIRPCQCVLISVEALDSILEAHPRACRTLLANVAARADGLVRRIARVAMLDADSRVAGFLHEHNGDLRWGKRNVALHLSLSSETFSRVLRRLSDAGLIAVNGEGPVRILARRALAEIAAGRHTTDSVAALI